MATSPIVAQVADLPCLDDFLKPYQISATDAIKANVVDYMKRLEESFEPIEGEPDTTPRRRASASEGADELVPAAHVVNAGRLDNKLQEWKRWEPERRGSLASASIRRTSGSNRPLHLASSFSTSDQSSSVEEVPVSIADYPTEDRSRSIVMARLPHIHRSHDRNHTWELTTKGIMKLILFYVPDAKITGIWHTRRPWDNGGVLSISFWFVEFETSDHATAVIRSMDGVIKAPGGSASIVSLEPYNRPKFKRRKLTKFGIKVDNLVEKAKTIAKGFTGSVKGFFLTSANLVASWSYAGDSDTWSSSTVVG